MTRFILEKHNRMAFIEFHEPDLDEHNVIERLNNIERSLFELSNEPNIDFIILKPAQENSQLGNRLHMHINEHLDVRVISKWEKIVLSIERLPKVTIAALSGNVSGPGVQLSLVCDYHFCLPDTTFDFSAIKFGFLPGMAIFRLAKHIGLGKAKKILITGKVIDAKCALDWGLCDEIVEDFNSSIKQFLAEIDSIQIEPIIMARQLLNNSYHDSYEDEIGDYLAAQVRCFEKTREKGR